MNNPTYCPPPLIKAINMLRSRKDVPYFKKCQGKCLAAPPYEGLFRNKSNCSQWGFLLGKRVEQCAVSLKWVLNIASDNSRENLQSLLSALNNAATGILVRMVRLLHCSSTPPCFFPDNVKGVSNTKRLMLWCISKSVFRSSASFSSKKGVTYVTWI